jgi:hypothetical protein
MRRFLATALVVAAGASVLAPHATLADPIPDQNGGALPPAPTSISADVLVLHATNDQSGIDPRIGPMPALSKPPFSSYNSYRLLSRDSGVALPRAIAARLKLPTGRDLHLVYKDVLPPTKQGGTRFVVAASIHKANGNPLLPMVEVNATPGEWFWVGGQEFRGGAVFIGIKINP